MLSNQPSDVIKYICGFLDTCNLVKVWQTSKLFNRLITDYVPMTFVYWTPHEEDRLKNESNITTLFKKAVIIDKLHVDPPSTYKYYCLSIVRHDTLHMFVKIRGVYSTREEARNRINSLVLNEYLELLTNIYVAEVGKWCIIPIDDIDITADNSRSTPDSAINNQFGVLVSFLKNNSTNDIYIKVKDLIPTRADVTPIINKHKMTNPDKTGLYVASMGGWHPIVTD